MIKTELRQCTRICQGDIFKNVETIESAKEESGILTINKLIFPYVYVLTQDCDLLQDFDNKEKCKNGGKDNQDKYLISVLVAPIYNAEHFISGTHLSELGIKSRPIDWKRSEGNNIRNNEVSRYHYLEFSKNVEIVNSIIDFKHYFSVHTETLLSEKSDKYICTVDVLYRENISHRFSSYLSRIGLPG
ncbi:hypothetical protein PCS_01895 [Desulfocurvibacter africanus PCS]|uniref:Uncharacterized protein n=1 Tax=Desulfocurvibacter africanus PCS TaxID=1262666 RepID=M5PSN7_DESAF|nr:hypothetical protein [Desulfocurvibacter africanus]EMG37382.1 hypothetical protein PCS_01895 [Desulfocurvibacter africanus PCS]